MMHVSTPFIALITVVSGAAWAQQAATEVSISPRIEAVVPLDPQPQVGDPSTIWYDDFDGPEKIYTEGSGGVDRQTAFARAGGSMTCRYEAESRGKGGRKVFFGDSPTGKVVRRGETFDEIYWRIYVRHQPGWISGPATPGRGGPDKMSRATSIVTNRWNQAMIAHVWSVGDTLTLDPAGGVKGDRVVTAKYNDFDNLHWLGNRPWAKLPIHSTAEAGWWVCVESRAKLNTPGKRDGINQLWIDGRLEAERTNLDWRGSYSKHGINAVFLEAYWNKRSPVTQTRWYDNFVISTKPIGPVVCPANPTLIRTPHTGAGKVAAWEVELAADGDGQKIVWRSHTLGDVDRCRADTTTGTFTGALAGRERLPAGMYFCRIRERVDGGEWSNWSRWHQAFRVADSTPAKSH